MKAIIHVNNAAHQKEHAAAIAAGLKAHGWETELRSRENPGAGDLAVIWGWKQPSVISDAKKRGIPVLVMERGHIQPRMEWTSCGFNGLGYRATYAKANDNGERWNRHFAHHMQDWKTGGEIALICGQVRGDAALYGVDFHKWAETVTNQAREKGYRVTYRPHPLSLRHSDRWCPKGAHFSERRLAEDLQDAAIAVTFNSTTGVESVLAGVPTVTCDQGAMAWPVTTHSVDDEPVRPLRDLWAHDLAWAQFRLDEIASGFAWERLKAILP